MRIQTEVIVSNSEEAKARAETSFKRKQEQAREGTKAWAEYEAQRRTVDEKIARLKPLRLAKEAAEANAAEGNAAAKKKRDERAPAAALTPARQPGDKPCARRASSAPYTCVYRKLESAILVVKATEDRL
jgi:hypothetical protein